MLFLCTLKPIWGCLPLSGLLISQYKCVGGIEGSRRNSIEPVALGSKLSFRVLYSNLNEWALDVFLHLLYQMS